MTYVVFRIMHTLLSGYIKTLTVIIQTTIQSISTERT